MIITMCGSSKFKDLILEIARKLTLEGNIVLSAYVFEHTENIMLNPTQKTVLERIHAQKINMSDAIFVVNKDKYIGMSTKMEIDYAINIGKYVMYLE